MCEEAMKVSIITVCYNSAKTIEHTIKSVAGQDYGNIEYIIIDGGSTDGTLDIIDRYKDKISVLVSEPDEGIYDAMNKGISIASGELIGMINSDDWYGPYTVSAAVRAMIEHPECGVVHGREITILPGGYTRVRRTKSVLNKDYLADFSHPTFFVRKAVYEKYGMYSSDYRTDGDADFVYRLYLAGVKFHYDDEVLAYFSLGVGASASSSAFRDRFWVHRKYIKKMSEPQRMIASKGLDRMYDGARLPRVIDYLNRRINWEKPALHKEKKIIIFAFDRWGQDLCTWLMHNGRREDIVAFVDNSMEKQGDVFAGIPVCSPDILKKDRQNVCVAIASIRYYDEILRQLQGYGFAAGKDCFGYFAFKSYISGTDIGHVFSWIRAGRKHGITYV